MGYGSSRHATSREQAVLGRLAEAERREVDLWIRSAIEEGIEMIRELIDARSHRIELDLVHDDHAPDDTGFVPDTEWAD